MTHGAGNHDVDKIGCIAPRACCAFAAVLTVAALIGAPTLAHAQNAGIVSEHRDVDNDGDQDAADLAKQLSNPVASLISVPFQFNWDTGIGPKDADAITLNIQPVIPFKLNEDWNLISRTILPVRWRDSPAGRIESTFGLGDVVQSLFLSPSAPVGGWIVGAGPVALLPTATDSAFQGRQLGLGPTAVGLRQHGGWTYGLLANHLWGVTNPDNRDRVNATFLQPFVSYTTQSATTFALLTESTYDWHDRQWTVPINVAVSQLVTIGDQHLSLQLGGRVYAEKPAGGPDWGLRAAVTFLFPK
jgi:hypothetical protein